MKEEFQHLFDRFLLTEEEVDMFPLNVLYIQVMDLTEQLVLPELVNTPLSLQMEDMREQFAILAKLKEIPEKDIFTVFEHLEALFQQIEAKCEKPIVDKINRALRGESDEQTQWISMNDSEAVSNLLQSALKEQEDE